MNIAIISVHGCPIRQAGEKDVGGMNIYLLETAKRISNLGNKVDIFTRRHDPKDPQIIDLNDNLRLIHIDSGPVDAEKNELFSYLTVFSKEMEDFINHEDAFYNILSTHYWLSGVVGNELSKKFNIPHVTTFHTINDLKQRAFPFDEYLPLRSENESLIANQVNHIVVWSNHEKESLISLYKVDPEKISIIPPGVDIEKFYPRDKKQCRKHLNLSLENKIILFVGRLEKLKGIDILIKVMSIIETSNTQLFIIGGEGNSPEVKRLKDLAVKLNVRENILFLGSIPQDELVYYYGSSDICVLPSYYESFGLAALEASACGKPVVASKVGGLPSIVLDGKTGYLVNWKCPGPFQEKIEVLLNNELLREHLGKKARIHSESLTWENSTKKLLDLLNEITSSVILK